MRDRFWTLENKWRVLLVLQHALALVHPDLEVEHAQVALGEDRVLQQFLRLVALEGVRVTAAAQKVRDRDPEGLHELINLRAETC